MIWLSCYRVSVVILLPGRPVEFRESVDPSAAKKTTVGHFESSMVK
jgi:hypothetical protein